MKYAAPIVIMVICLIVTVPNLGQEQSPELIEAKVLCGDPLLVKGIGNAVWNARFKPPTAAGHPIKLIDLLIYNFVAY